MLRALPFIIALAYAAEARADDTTSVRYGDRVALFDGVSLTIFAGGAALATQVESDVRYLGMLPMIVGTIGYVYGAPALHATHEKLWTARVSFAARAIVPLAGIAVTSQLRSCENVDSGCKRVSMALGASAGVLIVSTLDALVFARADVPVPYVAPSDGGATAGLAMRF